MPAQVPERQQAQHARADPQRREAVSVPPLRAAVPPARPHGPHERTHSREQPYVCELCGMRFTVSSSLRRHERKQHNKQRGREDERDSDPVPPL
jgi:uncharacterized Zn-finger protein